MRHRLCAYGISTCVTSNGDDQPACVGISTSFWEGRAIDVSKVSSHAVWFQFMQMPMQSMRAIETTLEKKFVRNCKLV